MSGPSPKKSPFKAVASKNATHCGYVSMSMLEPHKAYKLVDMKATHHAIYGDGLLSFLKGKNGSSWRSQFPPKYLQAFTDEDIKSLREEITKQNFPFIIFREVLQDKSFKIDLAPYSEELEKSHKLWTDVGEIIISPDVSLDSTFGDDDTTANDSKTANAETQPNSETIDQDQPNKRSIEDDGNSSSPVKKMKDEAASA